MIKPIFISFCAAHKRAINEAIEQRGLTAMVTNTPEALQAKLQCGEIDPRFLMCHMMVQTMIADDDLCGAAKATANGEDDPCCPCCVVKKYAIEHPCACHDCSTLDQNWIDGAGDEVLELVKTREAKELTAPGRVLN